YADHLYLATHPPYRDICALVSPRQEETRIQTRLDLIDPKNEETKPFSSLLPIPSYVFYRYKQYTYGACGGVGLPPLLLRLKQPRVPLSTSRLFGHPPRDTCSVTRKEMQQFRQEVH
ncbi:unnamed protein product, partial [Ectocarpus sp. 12 AP-2014]